MAQTVEDLVELGLSEAEAKRVINRKAKAEEKASSSKALAEKRLPKAQAALDYANKRKEHWTGVADAAQAKVDKYNAVISGESTEELPAEDDSDEAPGEAQLLVEAEAAQAAKPAKKTTSRRGTK